MKRFISNISLLCIVLFSVAALVGCVPNRIPKKTEEETVSKGREKLEAYVNTLPEKCEITDIYMQSGAKSGQSVYSGYYPSNVVSIRFSNGNNSYTAYVNLETEEIWSDYDMFDLNEQLARQLKPYFEKYGYSGDYAVDGASVGYHIISHDIVGKGSSEKIETEVCFTDVLPIDLDGSTAEERADSFLKNALISGFKIYYTKSDDNTYLTPLILSDYLKESGNYIDDYSINFNYVNYDYELLSLSEQGMKDYKTKGEVPIKERLNENWKMTLSLIEKPENMDYSAIHLKTIEENGFVITYPQTYQYGTLETIETDEAEFEACPVIIDGNTITYEDQSGEYACLYFLDKPDYSKVTRTRIIDEKEETEELFIVNIEDNIYSITDDNQRRKEYPYTFEATEKIVFE